ncbi:MAG: glycoside hydrolase family 2 [Hyphomicrobiales bacterium]|nr:glycoside hydrolase family 2 [Hyphomicrobiales bacterium]
MRTRLDLNGEWDFLHASNDSALEPVARRRIRVPAPWQAQFADLRMRAGIGAYRRVIHVPASMRDGRIYIVFGAVFHAMRLWVNGSPVGKHEGGFLPFSFDVTEFIVDGENEILVRAESPTDNPLAYPDAPLAEIPFGKQSWYGPLSGIWQSVYLESRNRDYIERARIVADLVAGAVSVTLFTHEPLARDAEITFAALDPDGEIVAQESVFRRSGTEEVTSRLAPETIKAWSPDHPHVYRMAMTISHGPQVVDRIEQTFGFRTFEAREGRFFLNGEPFYLRGALDQDYYPDTICTPPSEAFLIDQFQKAKQLGLNCVRCHIKAADPLYYDVADRIGLLVWSELPNGGLSTERSRARKERLLKGIVDRDSHHPSIVIWTIINENWGVDLVHDSSHRDWLKKTYHWLKQYDRTRLVVDNSPLAPSFHVQTDIADYHFYAGIPDHRHDWDAFVDSLASRPDWLFSPEGDAAPTGEEPLVCSEFGNWGLPDPADLAGADGREPWWFETGHDWGDGVMYPHGIEHRFNDWSLDRVFGDLRRFIVACQWQQFRALKYEIEAMRRKQQIAGYVITELTDVHWESNGLLDMRRNVRIFHDVFKDINADVVIAPKWNRLAYWDDEPAHVSLSIANGGASDITNASLELSGPHPMARSIESLAASRVVTLPGLDLAIAPVAAPARLRMEMSLRRNGEVAARNHLDICVFPAAMRRARVEAPIWSPDVAISEHLSALGYRVSGAISQARLIIAREFDLEIAKYLRDGGRLLLLPDREGLLQPLFPHWQNVRVVRRDGTVWRGDWASSFSWLRRDGPFSDIPGEPLLDEPFDRVLPSHVMTGCNLLDFQARVHAGLVVGWIHKPVALTVERAYGKGHFAATTFRLFRDEPGADPMATILLARHIALAMNHGDKPDAIEAQDARSGSGFR